MAQVGGAQLDMLRVCMMPVSCVVPLSPCSLFCILTECCSVDFGCGQESVNEIGPGMALCKSVASLLDAVRVRSCDWLKSRPRVRGTCVHVGKEKEEILTE